MTIKNHIISLILFLSMNAEGATQVAKGFEKPAYDITSALELDKDVTPPKPGKERCVVYPGFAVVEVSRPSLRGAESVEIRPRTGTTPSKTLCSNQYAGEKIKLPVSDGYLLGALKNYVFVDCSDTHGGACPFELFDAKTGKKVLNSIYDANREFRLKMDGKALKLSFYKILSQSSRDTCIPSTKEHACWDTILEENKIPAGQFGPPDCEHLFAKDPSLRKSNGTQFAAPVDLLLKDDSVKVIYKKKAAVCALNP